MAVWYIHLMDCGRIANRRSFLKPVSIQQIKQWAVVIVYKPLPLIPFRQVLINSILVRIWKLLNQELFELPVELHGDFSPMVYYRILVIQSFYSVWEISV